MKKLQQLNLFTRPKAALKVYCAGAYSAPTIIAGLTNMRIGMRAATEVLLAGYSPFCPWIDYNLFLQLRGEEEISLSTIYQVGLTWLEACNCVYVVPNPKNNNSKGTEKELFRAKSLNLPVFYRLEDLVRWATYEGWTE